MGAIVAVKPLIDAETRRGMRGLRDPNPGIGRFRTLPTVMASPPTLTLSAANAASAIANSVLWRSTNNGALANLDRFRYLGGNVKVQGTGYQGENVIAQNVALQTSKGYFFVEFMFDGQAFEWVSRGLNGNFRVLVDGQYVDAAPVVLDNSGSVFRYLVDFGSRAMRHVLVECFQAFLGIGVAATDTIWPPRVPVGPRVIFFGDSYTGPSSSEGAARTYTFYGATAARLLGWRDYWASGVGGSGYTVSNGVAVFADRVPTDVTPFSPDIVVVFGGQNDLGAAQSVLAAAASATFNAIRAGLPGASLIVVGPNRATSNPTANAVQSRDTLRQAANAAGALFVDMVGGPYPYSGNTADYTATPWITGTGKAGAPNGTGNADCYMGGTSGSDGNHPTQAGHDYLGWRLASAIAAALPL